MSSMVRGSRPGRGQSGATLVVALIMLTLITLLVVNAFTLSSSNLKAVGNMQRATRRSLLPTKPSNWS
ncbi:hypothetical protein LP417_03665 [Polaromonas sp. P1-6]|nr:hypothetical protein LP417_03665 [Polaromonas sp. P1-6]